MGDNGASFSAATAQEHGQVPNPAGLIRRQLLILLLIIMKADLVKAASEVITNQQILVNMVSRRVRQLCLGHRPLVEFVPGLGHADIALSEIASGKLVFESTFGQNGKPAPAEVVQFPGVIVSKKTAVKAKKAA
jgi:DNA-directed RNA polymerase subunit K/omega